MSIRRFVLVGFAAASLWAAADPSVAQAKKLVAEKKYDEAIATLEKAEKAHPKAADVQKGLADTYLAQADSMMKDAALPPRVKYRGALKAYRKVLQYDKTNKHAQEGVSTIEGVYKSMGMPVPQ
jgi:tetratricopeptide (TPR) repeat protein